MTKSKKPSFYLGFSGKKTNEIKKGLIWSLIFHQSKGN